jgi:hypothetical protein
MEVSGQLHGPAAFLPGKQRPAPILQEPPSRSGLYGEEENFFPYREWNPDLSVVQLVAYTARAILAKLNNLQLK